MPQVGTIIVRADGTVPFDKLPDGNEHPHKAAFLAEIARRGHKLEHREFCHHYNGHACSCHPRIANWKGKINEVSK